MATREGREDCCLHFRYNDDPSSDFSLMVSPDIHIDALKPLIRQYTDTLPLHLSHDYATPTEPSKDSMNTTEEDIILLSPDGNHALGDELSVHDIVFEGSGELLGSGPLLVRRCGHHEGNGEGMLRISTRINNLPVRQKDHPRRKKRRQKPLREKVLRKQLMSKMEPT